MSNNTNERPFPDVMRWDFTLDYSNWTEDLLALYNRTKVTEEEVAEFIDNYGSSFSHYHPHIIVMSPEQFESIFSKEEVNEEEGVQE